MLSFAKSFFLIYKIFRENEFCETMQKRYVNLWKTPQLFFAKFRINLFREKMRNFPFFLRTNAKKLRKFCEILLETLPVDEHYVAQKIRPLNILNKYKVVISVCLSVLFVWPIMTREPMDRFASNFDLGTRESHMNVLSFLDFKLNGSTFNVKI